MLRRARHRRHPAAGGANLAAAAQPGAGPTYLMSTGDPYEVRLMRTTPRP